MEASVSDDAFAQYLHRTGMARPEQIEQARQQQAEAAANGVVVNLGEALVQLGIITDLQREDSQQKIQARQAGPKQLGNYKLIKKLGEGGMGAVYLAEDTMMRRPVALKLLLDKHAGDERFLARFRREVRAIGNLNHPNVVTAYSVGEELGQQYFVMEYCEGEPLDARLKRDGRLTEKDALDIIVQIALGLQHAHDHGIIHRDIKPGNIFIAREGTAKILDMGLSKDVVVDELASFNTQSGITLGTPHYVSPEQAEGRHDLDGRTDIYSLGSTLYHLVTGRTPYSGTTLSIITSKITREAPPDPRKANPDLSGGMVVVINKMMARDLAERYTNCAELLDDLERLRSGQPLTINDPATVTVASRADGRRTSEIIGVPTAVLPSKAGVSRAATKPDPIVAEVAHTSKSDPGIRNQESPPKQKAARSNAVVYAVVAGSVVAALFIGVSLGSGKPAGNADPKAPQVPAIPPAPPPTVVVAPPQAPVPVAPPPSIVTPSPPPVVLTPAPPPPPPPAAGKWAFLSELPETVVRTVARNDQGDWRYKTVGFNKGHWGQQGRAIQVNKVESPHGLAMYPESSDSPAEISYQLGKQYQALRGSVAIDDGAYNKGTMLAASPVTFTIRAYGKNVWTSKPLQHAGESQEFNIVIAGTDKLDLIVACKGNSDFCMGAWIEPRVQAASTVFLSDLQEVDVKTIDQNSEFYARWSFGKGNFGRPNGNGVPIRINGNLSPHGLAMNVRGSGSDARVSYVLGKRYQTLLADAAINDSANHPDNQGNMVGSASPLTFRVFGDGKELWHSKPLQRGGDTDPCKVDASAVERLELVVDCPGSWWAAQGAWVEPRLIPAAGGKQ